MSAGYWILPAGLALTATIALVSALPQLAGLATIAVPPPVQPSLRVTAQCFLFLPLVIAAVARSGMRGFSVLPFAAIACGYAWFPAPYFDYVWDVFLIEALFLFLCGEAVDRKLGIWLLRLLLFKLMFCMGLVKFLHGMPEWRDGTALKYFWQNQPMPGYFAWHFAQWGDGLQRLMALFVFLVEIPGPFLIFAGRRPRLVYFFLNLVFQAGIFISGNYGFFNILTVVVSFSLWDFSPRLNAATRAPVFPRVFSYARWLSLLLTVGWLATSAWYVFKTIAPGRAYLHETSWVFLGNEEQKEMFAPVRGLVAFFAAAKASNPYALFGIIPKYRLEIAVEGSADGLLWKPYGFHVRPDTEKAPVWYAPHHWRLDHQMYYESFRIRDPQMHAQYSFFLGAPWSRNLYAQLLAGDTKLQRLFAAHPFAKNPPAYIRLKYLYFHFTNAQEKAASGKYWKTESTRPGQFHETPFGREQVPQL